MKKSGRLFLALIIIIICCVPFAFASEAYGDGVFWSVENGVLSISGSGEPDNCLLDNDNRTTAPWAEITDEFDSVYIGQGVTSVPDNAFAGLKNIKRAVISSSVKRIGAHAFLNCTGLENVELVNGTEELGQFCFSGSGIKRITVPSTVSAIGKGAFHNCIALEEICVSPENRYFKSSAGVLFSADGRNLVSFPAEKSGEYVIPEGTENILSYAFYHSRINTLYVPNGIKDIGYFAFCASSLSAVNFSCLYEPDYSVDKSNTPFIDSPKGMDYRFGYCGENAMWAFKANTLKVFGEGEMNNGFIEENEEIKRKTVKIEISGGITDVPDYAFSDFTALESINLADSIEKIGAFAFYGSKLIEIYLPSSLSSLDASALLNCERFKKVTVAAKNSKYSVKNGYLYADSGKELCLIPYVHGNESVYIPYGVKKIGPYALLNGSFSGIYIPSTVEYIGKCAFKNVNADGVFFECTENEYGALQVSAGNEVLSAGKHNVHPKCKVIKGYSASCEKNGLSDGSVCTDCGKTVVSQKVIKAPGHTPVTDKAVKATTSKSGYTSGSHCSVCGKTIKKQTKVYRIKNVKLSKTKIIYDKKVHKPSVTVTDYAGKKLVNGTDYSVKYSNSKSKATGRYSVTVTFKGKYSGSKKLIYSIAPVKVKGLTVKSPSKGKVSVEYKKADGATGYVIYYSTSKTKGYKKLKTLTGISCKCKMPMTGKTYYFRVRAYKSSNGKRVYGAYSDVVKRKVK